MVTIFEQGDIVCLDFDPQADHEQRGRCPALVVSSNLFNRINNLTMVCPITHTGKEHPFHIRLEGTVKTGGVVLCDQARMLDLTLDLNSRSASFVEKAPVALTAEAVDLLIGFMEIR